MSSHEPGVAVMRGQESLPLPLEPQAELVEPVETRTVAPVELATPCGDTPRYTVLPSPIGDLLLVGDGRSLTGLHMRPDDQAGPAIGRDWRDDPGSFTEAAQQLRAYFAGELRVFDIPVAPRGTPFQRRVWRALTTIPYGRTATYGQIAVQVGRPTAFRAVGMANGRNPVSIVVPCHRVVGADGTLTGYGGGLHRKEHLLALERRGQR